MFTGIIESLGEVAEIKAEASNVHFLFSSNISHELKVDQSVSHNGVCLTVTKLQDGQHWVTAIEETLKKSMHPVSGNKIEQMKRTTGF